MTKRPLVSVLMTAYNREKYIAQAIESVLASTLTDFELIIVDDRSTDQTTQIAESYKAKDSRISVYINEKNLGDYNNRNKAASYAKGRYIKYLDSDDFIYPHSLDVMARAMQQFPQAAFGFSFYGVQVDSGPFPILYEPADSYYQHFFQGGFFYAGPGGTLIDREKFQAVGGFSGKRFIGDTELWMRLAREFPLVLFSPSLIWWRKHEGQEFNHGNTSEEYILLNYQVTDHSLNDALCPLEIPQRKQAIRNNKNLLSRNIWKKIISGKFARASYLKKNGKVSTGDVLLSLLPLNKIRRLFVAAPF
ncbi:MAG TPA: glycosyltransferase family A protein [Puia sp.]